MTDSKKIDLDRYSHVVLTNQTPSINTSEVVNSCRSLKTKYEQERHLSEQTWRDAWGVYLTTPEAREYASSRVIDVIGNIDFNWRHNLVTAKAYEVVETIVSYLQSSFFPNSQWFDLTPRAAIPNNQWREITEVNRLFIANKLHNQHFQSIYRQYLREMCITGTAGIALPWRTEVKETFTNAIHGEPETGVIVVPKKSFEKTKNAPDLQVISVLDFFLDPTIDDPNESNVIRRFHLTRGDLIQLIDSGKYPMADIDKIRRDSQISDAINDRAFTTDLLFGVSATDSPDAGDGNTFSNSTISDGKVELFEFWGDIVIKNVEFKDIYIVWTGRHLLDFVKNPYWSGKPFQFGSYSSISGTPYGIGCLQPILPNLYQQNVFMSRRADNISIGSDMMFTVLADGVTNMDEVYTAPGHKIPVTDHDAVRPLQLTTDQSVSLSEEGVLEQRIDKATGTGPFIGVGAGRTAERVTAQEIQAQRDAGGNRLNGVYSHIEETSMVPFLEKYHELCRQFIVEDEFIRFPMGNNRFADIFVGPRELQFPMAFRALGAGHIAEKEFQLKQLTDWVQFVSTVESLAENVNWNGVLRALTVKMVPDQVNDLIISEEEQMARIEDQQALLAQQQQQGQADPLQQAQESAQFVGGTPAVSALQESAATGQAPQELAQLAQALGLS